MSDIITLTGFVATVPRVITTQEGLAITSFRLASSQRRFDRAHDKWVDGDTNWYTVTTFRQLAANAAVSVKKGERVVVMGRLRIRDWVNGERTGTNVDIEADTVGHDLGWGTASFSRNTVAAQVEAPSEQTPAAEFPTEAALAATSAAPTSASPAAATTTAASPVSATAAAPVEVPF